MKIFWHIFVLATVLATFSKNWENFSKSSGHPGLFLHCFDQFGYPSASGKLYEILDILFLVFSINFS
jgi:hypothetical protein